MKIDTLIMSGGGPSGIAYIGIFDALYEKGILKRDLSGIKEIIVASVGIIFAYLYMLDFPEESQRKIVMKANMFSMLNVDDLNIDDLLVDFGCLRLNVSGFHGCVNGLINFIDHLSGDSSFKRIVIGIENNGSKPNKDQSQNDENIDNIKCSP